jgi:CRP-like cAMP-binding protein
LVLSQLGEADLDRLTGHLQRVELSVRMKIEAPHKAITHVYFVEDGIVSVVATGPQRQTIEVGVVGYEGLTGVPVILGADRSPFEVYVQVPGQALRIAAAHLLRAMAESPSLCAILFRHAHVFHVQVSYTALANGRAKLEERLARWLLMAQDRMRCDQLRLTHEFLAMMLAVRRPGVTVALAMLQKQGLLAVHRGSITIVDRAGLEAVADKYYGAPEAELKRLIGSPRRG